MAEFLEKVAQPELIVSPTIDADCASGSENAAHADRGVERTENISGSAGGTRKGVPASSSTNNHEVSSNNSEALSKSVTDAQIKPSRNDLLPNDLSQNEPSSNESESRQGAPRVTPGLKRHRAITAGCIALSLSLLSLALLDLNSLIEKKGTLTTNLKFENEKKSKLPEKFSYYHQDVSPQESEGMRPIKSADWNNELMGFADKNENVVIPLVYYDVGDFHDGVAAVKPRVRSDVNGTYVPKDSQRWQYIDKTGKVILPANYTYAGEFKNGVAPVVIDDFGALIDKAGNVIHISTAHSAPRRLGDLYSVKASNSYMGLVDKSGKFVVPPEYDKIEKIVPEPEETWRRRKDFSPNLFTVWKSGLCGLVDESGKLLVPVKYENIKSFNRGYAVVEKQGNYGMIDSKGKFLLEPEYKMITMYDDVIAALDHKTHWTVFNSNGEKLPIKIDGAISDDSEPWLSDGLAGVVIGDKCGYINRKGELVIQPIYEFVRRFSSGYGLVQQNGLFYFIDTTGRRVLQTAFSSATSFKNGVSNVSAAGSLFTFVNSNEVDRSKDNASGDRDKFKDGTGEPGRGETY